MLLSTLIDNVTDIANVMYKYYTTNHNITISLFNNVHYLCQAVIKIKNNNKDGIVPTNDYNNIKSKLEVIRGLALGADISSKDYNSIMEYSREF